MYQTKEKRQIKCTLPVCRVSSSWGVSSSTAGKLSAAGAFAVPGAKKHYQQRRGVFLHPERYQQQPRRARLGLGRLPLIYILNVCKRERLQTRRAFLHPQKRQKRRGVFHAFRMQTAGTRSAAAAKIDYQRRACFFIHGNGCKRRAFPAGAFLHQTETGTRSAAGVSSS